MKRRNLNSALTTKKARLEYLKKSRKPKSQKRFKLTLVSEPENNAPEVDESNFAEVVQSLSPDIDDLFVDLRTRDYSREEIGL
jgi:hypothetical protein